MRDCLRWANAGALTPAQSRKVLGLGLELGACVRVAKEAGVRLAVGTDYISREQHGRNLDEDPGDLSAFGEPGAVTGVFKGGKPAVAHPRVREAGLAMVPPA